MKTLKYLSLLLIFLMAAQVSHAQTKPKKEIKVSAKTISGKMDKNPNIKKNRPADDANVKKGDDKNKIGSKAGSGAYNCYVNVQNYSGYTVDCYLDGYYIGTMGAYGSLNAVTGTGYTTFYGISAGRTVEWNMNGDCSYDYTFNLYE